MTQLFVLSCSNSLSVLLVYFSETINELAAIHWRTFSRQQYFDSNGLFISTVFSIPILLNCMLMIVSSAHDISLLHRGPYINLTSFVFRFRAIGYTIRHSWCPIWKWLNWRRKCVASNRKVNKPYWMQHVRSFIVSSTQFDVEWRKMVRDAHIEGVLMYNNYYFKMASTDCMNVYLLL